MYTRGPIVLLFLSVFCGHWHLTVEEEISCNDQENMIFQCLDGSCISRQQFCDGIPTCSDGSDEMNSTTLHPDGIENCRYRRGAPHEKACVLPALYKCDHEIDCIGGKDECDCEHTFQCDNGDCVLKVSFCDNLPSKWGCADGTDEKEYNRTTKQGFQCPVTRTHVTKVCSLPDQYVCDGDSDCDFGIDECFCNFTNGKKKGTPLKDVYSNENCFRCLDGSLIIPNIHVCDGIVHCDDLSDECACPETRGYVRPEICGTVCKGAECGCPGLVECRPKSSKSSTNLESTKQEEKICLDHTSICDDLFDCQNQLDEMFCPLDNQSFPCQDGSMKVKKWQQCNGPLDCPDGSDEANCHKNNDHFCEEYRKYFPGVQNWRNVSEDEVQIPPGITLPFDRPFFTRKCDGIPLCPGLDDECMNSCETEPEYCGYITRGFRCPNSGSLIIGVEICDGKPTCNDTAPELSVDEFGCPGRFYCHDKGKNRLPIHIPIEGKCNGKQECDDKSDELNCSQKTHFYCEDGGSTLFVPINQVCDGRKDCKEGRDECQNCNPSPFSSDEKLISSRVLVIFLWIIGSFAVIGNSAAIAYQIVNLVCPSGGTPSPVAVSNRILVLNLSAADLLVGIYLVGLGVKDATVSEYCLLDQEWRSSTTCSALGSIALIGTETSVFILLIMTAYRLYLVVKPFKAQKLRIIGLSVIVAWLFSFCLAFAPLATSAQDYFVSCVWFRSHYFIGRVCRKDLQKFTQEIVLLGGNETMFADSVKNGYTWNNMFSVMKHLNSSYYPERFFGYYSAHSVCLPRLFPDRELDEVWGYSLFLILINFFAFCFILISYIYIYRKTTHRNLQKAKSEDRANALQRKVTRIVLTDFCCWMPICIMAFIKVAGPDVPDIAYAFTAIILLPINSAMNPFLYSDSLDIFWEKLLPIRNYFKRLMCGAETDSPSDQPDESRRKIRSRKKLAPNSSCETRSTGTHSAQCGPSHLSELRAFPEMKPINGNHKGDDPVFYEMKVSLSDETDITNGSCNNHNSAL